MPVAWAYAPDTRKASAYLPFASMISLPTATAKVGPAIDMLGTHSVIAPVSGLDDLARAVDDATDGIGSLDPRPTYRGHITVARVKRGAIVRKVVGMLCGATFDVDSVALVESRLRPEGSEFRTLATWPTGTNW